MMTLGMRIIEMVKVGPSFKGCNYWGYGPASGEMKDAIGILPYDKRMKLREQFKTELKTIRDGGERE